jgi:hypothetical protein
MHLKIVFKMNIDEMGMMIGMRQLSDQQTGGLQPSEDLQNTGLLPGVVGSAERVAYMADMILELHQMAETSGYATLAAILRLAHIEAQQAARRL